MTQPPPSSQTVHTDCARQTCLSMENFGGTRRQAMAVAWRPSSVCETRLRFSSGCECSQRSYPSGGVDILMLRPAATALEGVENCRSQLQTRPGCWRDDHSVCAELELNHAPRGSGSSPSHLRRQRVGSNVSLVVRQATWVS